MERKIEEEMRGEGQRRGRRRVEGAENRGEERAKGQPQPYIIRCIFLKLVILCFSVG